MPPINSMGSTGLLLKHDGYPGQILIWGVESAYFLEPNIAALGYQEKEIQPVGWFG